MFEFIINLFQSIIGAFSSNKVAKDYRDNDQKKSNI
ncbi:hypothetical protein R078138_01447 [Convivina praedatoris]|uniref:Uncharacterized protein n=1 Tax=Convivina praedatoris TaxID=2880963 RepID=A0ABN8HAK5_9LACO|nr:hypothetical protein R077815_01294 [Convivina sp. LMG 32447]CAH1856647.1 hypothetical protein LMG032447_01336 [Convivina sp. LMG 32447]CAH1856835.1 hypothetical protein R078138_01447 [Convivina sp. LMG 32447]